ncbi:MAG TPA: arginine--tRNA ligase [Verrucomicrobiae bacterium]|nr:arginine--tRNA ligase [Verrucomicrobiae bacterium]
MLPHKSIEARLQAAVSAALPGADISAVLVRPCPDPKFGDYQSNALMALAKERKMNPRQLATDVVAKLDVAEWCEKVEIAGAGFLNFRLKQSTLAESLQSAARGAHLFFEKTTTPRSVVVDFSSPNVAKPMHVGHIRSTILGDSLARTMRLLGHRVVTDNHIGDWGTQFGKLLVGWKTQLDRAALAADPIGEMERLYKTVNAAGEADPGVEAQARQELVKLQAGDQQYLHIWQEMIELSEEQFNTIYGRLGIEFDYTYGESFYNARLKGVVQELRDKGVARESEGAIAVFSDGTQPPKHDPFLKSEDGEWKPNPFLIQKSDGAANYGTTDLATLAYRLETWHPDEIVYVTDGRQQLHFQQLFATFGRWHPEARVKLAHVWFGSILGDDGKPFKTRSGETVKLAELLDEAEERAYAVVSEKNAELPEPQRREIARVVGLGAIKYADLLPNRQSDYVFSWDKMLAFNGNTAPYVQYAYARIQSIFSKGGIQRTELDTLKIAPAAPEELSLARHLLNFGLTLEAVAEEYRPNFLCNYLYELAGHFARFFEKCPVLKAEPAERASRLVLCDLTARVLQQGLDVLGIETLEQM